MRYPYQPRALANPAMTALVMAVLVMQAGAQTRTARARDLYFEGDAPAAVHHLGLRYNLLLVNPETRESHAVDPDSNFSRGNCVAVEFSPNRDGHLYIFNRGSSGDLQVLLPSAAMPDEASLVRAGKTVRVPQEYCFMLNDPPGVETLVVAVTEHPEAVEELRRAVGGGAQMGGRDLIMETTDEPASAGEPAHAVYAVQSKAGESSRLMLEIKIRHEQK